ncbi:hypothetical protein STCU_09508 [Strigomonas culicis]|nr:hypothetical protein STCU_09508 [Strigomonas culicis]|eukprot:EPY19343.1 hypothetical protein STCU_09508 [Strigomonas culicis]
MIRLFNEQQDCICVTHVMDTPTGATTSVHSVVQCGKSTEGYMYDGVKDNVVFKVVPMCQYRSCESGILFTTEWTVQTPTHDGNTVHLQLTASFRQQEFITIMAMPSFWEGTVDVRGTVTKSDGTTEEVFGDGYVASWGRGKQIEVEEEQKLFHDVTIAPMERPEIANAGDWKAIAEGPAIPAVVVMKNIFKMHKQLLTMEQEVVLTALLGAYGYIYHHPHNAEAVAKALEWCYEKWTMFYGVVSIDVQTLTLRSYMLCELGRVMQQRCSAMARKAVALDVAVPRLISQQGKQGAAKAMDMMVRHLTRQDVLRTPAKSLDLSQLDAHLSGVWATDPDRTVGSLNEVLREQNVGVLWRHLMSKQTPVYTIEVKEQERVVKITSETLLDRLESEYRVDGTEWTWTCRSRGPMRSRACILQGGAELYVESLVGIGVERIWWHTASRGKVLVEYRSYYRYTTTDTPVASCTTYFNLKEK